MHEYETFADIDKLVPDIDTGAQLAVDKYGIQLANQLIRFQRRGHDCHEQLDKEHADKHAAYSSLQAFVTEVADDTSHCPDVLYSGRTAH